MLTNEQEIYQRIKEDAKREGFVAGDVANWQGASYLVLALPYLPTTREDLAMIARFACHDNYRRAVDLAKKLRKSIALYFGVPSKILEIMCNSQHVNEKQLALLSGVGFYGKNSLIMVDEWGSFVVLLAIRLPVHWQWINHEERVALECQNCDLCQRSCPSQALHRAYHLDRTLCLQSMASNGLLPITNTLPVIYGCDICQNVCPYNRRALARYQALADQASSSRWCDSTLWQSGSLEEITQALAKSPLQFRWLDKRALMLNARLRSWHKLFSMVRHKEREE